MPPPGRAGRCGSAEARTVVWREGARRGAQASGDPPGGDGALGGRGECGEPAWGRSPRSRPARTLRASSSRAGEGQPRPPSSPEAPGLPDSPPGLRVPSPAQRARHWPERPAASGPGARAARSLLQCLGPWARPFPTSGPASPLSEGRRAPRCLRVPCGTDTARPGWLERPVL